MTNITFEHLELSMRATNMLENCGINTVEGLQGITANTLRKQRHCGENTLKEIREKMSFYGLALAGDIVIQSKAGIELIREIPELLIKLKTQVKELQYQLKDIGDMIERIRISQED